MLATLMQLRRRAQWIVRPVSAQAAANLASTAVRYVTHRQRAAKMPPMVKIDISPLCALACPSCLHADPKGRDRPLLERQRFDASHRMTLDQFQAIIDQLRGRSLAVSLYYYGDPLMHPQFPQFARIAADAGLSVHATSHLSYNLSDEKIAELADCGLAHLTVAVDGATQETYSHTRIRGRLDFVLSNLARIAAERDRMGKREPVIEVQHLSFAHHPTGEAGRVEQIVRAAGADHFTTFPGAYHDVDGDLYNAVDSDRGATSPGHARSRGPLPKCHWPYSGTVIKYDGDVIPCCKWREGHQYSTDGDPRSVGNVFQTPLADIWNGPAYRQIRREVSDPATGAGNKSFCEGCPELYDTPSRLGDWQRG